jgi:hypothetical protein
MEFLTQSSQLHHDLLSLVIACIVILSLSSLYQVLIIDNKNILFNKLVTPPSEGLFVACSDSDANNRMKRLIHREVGDFVSPWWYSPHLGTIVPFGHGKTHITNIQIISLHK